MRPGKSRCPVNTVACMNGCVIAPCKVSPTLLLSLCHIWILKRTILTYFSFKCNVLLYVCHWSLGYTICYNSIKYGKSANEKTILQSSFLYYPYCLCPMILYLDSHKILPSVLLSANKLQLFSKNFLFLSLSLSHTQTLHIKIACALIGGSEHYCV